MTTRWGIAATGGMAAAFSEDLAHVPGAEIAFVGSRSPESAADFAGRFGARASGTYADLLAAGRDGEVDVIYVATPHPQHHDLALAAIEGGTPLLVEKAFTATLAGAQEVVDAARAAQVFCMEAMWTRFQPAVVHARELIAAGEIGELLLVQADFCAQRDYDPIEPALRPRARRRLGPRPRGLPDLVRPAPPRPTRRRHGHRDDVRQRRRCVRRLPPVLRRRARGVADQLARRGAPGRATIVGTKGSIEIEPPFHHPTRIVVRRNGQEVETVDRPTTGRGYAHQAIEVQDCLAAGRTESTVMSLADTLDVQWVLEESLRQLGIEMTEARVDLDA